MDSVERLRLRLVHALEFAQEQRWESDLPPTLMADAEPVALIETSYHHGYLAGIEFCLTAFNEEIRGAERE
jgi:hypothetical protein